MICSCARSGPKLMVTCCSAYSKNIQNDSYIFLGTNHDHVLQGECTCAEMCCNSNVCILSLLCYKIPLNSICLWQVVSAASSIRKIQGSSPGDDQGVLSKYEGYFCDDIAC